MQPPVLVTPPSDVVVSVADLKMHLRIDASFEDGHIEALELAAVAHFDGWRGVLGRAIMPQSWSQDFDDWGNLKLLLPDVSGVTVIGIKDGVETAATTAVLCRDMAGFYVVADGDAADTVRVTYTAALPVEQLPAVQMAVKLLVGHWYQNREAVTEGTLSAAPMAVTALLAPLRVVNV